MTSHDHNSPFDADVDEDGNVHLQYKSERLGVLGQGATTEPDESAQSTIEDKLKELYDFIDRGILSKSGRVKYRQMLQAIITTETTKARLEELLWAQTEGTMMTVNPKLQDRIKELTAALQKEQHDLP